MQWERMSLLQYTLIYATADIITHLKSRINGFDTQKHIEAFFFNVIIVFENNYFVIQKIIVSSSTKALVIYFFM